MRTDEMIKKQVVDRLATDSRVDASDVKVEVHDGKVELSGKVLTYSDKNLASDIAWFVNGVIGVGNSLDVELSSTIPVPTDIQIKESIENLLKWNSKVEESKVSVDVSAGIVTLEGSVPNYWQKLEAEDDASRATGVIDIVNKLAVVPTEKISDELIGERVMDRIEQAAPLRVDDVDVRVSDGAVTLNGELPSYNDWSSVYDTTKNTIGVTDVKDNIMISYKS